MGACGGVSLVRRRPPYPFRHRAFAAARGWTVVEYTDHGVSGAKETRPALDAMLKAARGRKLDDRGDEARQARAVGASPSHRRQGA